MAITHEMYRAMLGGNTLGRVRKANSDMIMDATFDGDIQYQVAYFFDYYHTTAENRLKLEGFDPETDPNAVPIEIKFIAHTKKTYEKDQVTMHIQFRPGHKCAVDYYPEVFGNRYNACYPVGLYCWVKGEDEIYRRWLVVEVADAFENQFPTYEILRCDDIYRWVKNGKFYEFPGVSRSQNSYNSGLWLDYRFQQPEDQVKFALPLTRDTECLYYNTRMIIDANVLSEPRAWLISKINRNASKGVIVFTATQDLFNINTDQVFLDESGNVKYWVADWNQSMIVPSEGIHLPDTSSIFSTITSKISYSGIANQIRVGGSKTFTVTFFNDEIQVEDYLPGDWKFLINNVESFDEIEIILLEQNKVKIRVKKDDSLIGKILTVINQADTVISQVDLEIIAL